MSHNYKPNLQDPRVQQRVRHAVGFVRGCIDQHESQSWSTRYIDRYLGQQQHPLSRWLRQHLLICIDDYHRIGNSVSRGHCKKYLMNREGYQYVVDCLRDQYHRELAEWQQLRSLRNQQYQQDQVESTANDEKELNILNIPYCITSQDQQLVDQWAQAEFQQELTELRFEYQDKSSRLWHPLQRVRREYKIPLLSRAGLPHQYDIVCAAPTLLHQHSWRIPYEFNDQGLWQQGPMDLWLDALRDYTVNRNSRRQELADRIGIPQSTAKTIITALFCGAQISHNRQTDIFKQLAGSHDQINLLKQDRWLTHLRSDIRQLWDYINRTIERRQNPATGRRLPVNARQKWYLYFDLERSVLNSVRQYLRERDIRHFLEHDGWTTEVELDQAELQQHIQDTTGFVLQLEYKYCKRT